MEILDIVNQKDEVIGQAERKEVYAHKYLHRIVHVLIFNDQGEMAMQLRSAHVAYCPRHWSTTVGGHVQVGEDYKTAALREYQEELGIQTDIELFKKDFYQGDGGISKFLTTYKTTFNGPFNPDPEVVEDVGFFSLDQIKEKIQNGEKFHPELLFLLKKYFIPEV